jgi:hypothetical protein
MTFSYSEDPSTSQKDEVRFLLGDTKDSGHFIEDAEIEWAIDKWGEIQGSMEYVASTLADNIAARFAQEASYSADGVSISLGPVGEQFRALAASLRQQHKSLLVGGSPDVGGISPYEQRDPDIKNFSFGTGMHDDLGAGSQDYGDQGAMYYPAETTPGS